MFWKEVNIYEHNDRALNILWSHQIQSFILKSGNSMNYQPNGNVPKLKLNNSYGNTRMNWMGKHGTLNFTPAHMNPVLAEEWQAFKRPYARITW